MYRKDYSVDIGKSKIKKSYLDGNTKLNVYVDTASKANRCIGCNMVLDSGMDCKYCGWIKEND